jgi:hypothetical protein
MESQARLALPNLGSFALRRVARRFGVPPHFSDEKTGRIGYLRNTTIRARVLERAERDKSWEFLLSIIQADKGGRTGPDLPDVPEVPSVPDAPAALVAHKETLKLEGQRADKSAPGLVSELEALIRRVAAEVASRAVDEEAVRKIVAAEVAKIERPPVTIVRVKRPEVPEPGPEMIVHKQFPKLLRLVSLGLNVYLCGPAGSGKTHAAHQVAQALGLPFYFNGAIDTEYKLLGFVDAQGKVVSTPFRCAVTGGGVYLFDEMDGSLPPALLAFNAALANGHCDFPGSEKPIARHADCRIIAAANTWGYGADAAHVGRNKLDAASLDRFVSLPWEYDEALERRLAGNDKWVNVVVSARKRALELGLKVVISPRASISGAAMLADGMTEEEAISATFGARISPADRSKLGV